MEETETVTEECDYEVLMSRLARDVRVVSRDLQKNPSQAAMDLSRQLFACFLLAEHLVAHPTNPQAQEQQEDQQQEDKPTLAGPEEVATPVWENPKGV